MCINLKSTKEGQRYACGKCEQCHTRYIQHWVFRIQQELRQTHSGVFLTLTYDYDNIPIAYGSYITSVADNCYYTVTKDKKGDVIKYNKYQKSGGLPKSLHKGKFTLLKPDYQNFLKRLRRALSDRTIKYVCAGEYGSDRSRPHYHLLLLGVDINDFNTLNKCWGKGLINIGAVESASIAYVFKYAVKDAVKKRDWRQVRPFVAMSKGLGEKFAFDISYITDVYTNKKGNFIVRKSKIRTPKRHFQAKLDTLHKMPYYQIPSSAGGTVKMSVPRFFIRVSNYDTELLREVYEKKMDEKYALLTDAQREYCYNIGQIQVENSINSMVSKAYHSISKEKL